MPTNLIIMVIFLFVFFILIPYHIFNFCFRRIKRSLIEEVKQEVLLEMGNREDFHRD